MIAVLFALLAANDAFALMGYKASIFANGTSYEIERSVNDMQFSNSENITGEGRFSTFKEIGDPAQTYSKETTCGLGGKVSKQANERYASQEGPVRILTYLNGTANLASLTVDELWQFALLKQNAIDYKGDFPLYSSTDDRNNGDQIKTRFESLHIIKATDFRAQQTRMYLNASVDPNGVHENKMLNATTKYDIDLGNEGLTDISYSDSASNYEQYYVGNYRLTARLNKSQIFILPNETETWLPCCSWPMDVEI